MKYFELIKVAKESTNENAPHTKQQLYVIFFRMLGFYAAPFFLMLNVSANKVSFFGLLLGLISSGLILSGYVFFGIVAYFFAVLLDHVDGVIARVNNTATFYGRFIDGFIGIIIVTLIRLSLSVLLTKNYGLNLIVWFGIISTILSPMHYLFFDRYILNISSSDFIRPDISVFISKYSCSALINLFCKDRIDVRFDDLTFSNDIS